MQYDKSSRYQVSLQYMELALEYFEQGDIQGALETAGNAAIIWGNWREPFCLLSKICFQLNDVQAGERYIDIARNIPRPEQAVLNEIYYDEISFNEYVKSISKPVAIRDNSQTASDDVIKILLGGDVLLGRQTPGHVALKGSKWPFMGIQTRLNEADLVMVNLESAVSTIGDFIDKGGRQPYYYHNHPDMLDVLVDSGIQVVCIGNNHAMDYGREALAQQCELLDACGFVRFGAGRNEVEAAKPAYVQVGELTVAFIGIETETPYMCAEIDAAGIHYRSENEVEQAVAASMALARAHADIIIVSPHWGKNWKENPSSQFRTLAKSFIDLGADAVLGHSAHILQGVELYRGAPIVYDMGTLLFDRVAQDRMRYTALFELELSSEGVRNLEIVPVRLSRAQASLATKKNANYIRELIVNLSQSLDPEISFTQKGDGLQLKCTPSTRCDLIARKLVQGLISTQDSLRHLPEKYRQLVSNVVYAEMPKDCAWQRSVVVNEYLEVLGSQCAKTMRPQRGFVCDVFFNADPPPVQGRWEACITALDSEGEIAFVYKHPVAEGVWPVERWSSKEIICDHIVVRPVVKAPEGKYSLFWHLLDLENQLDMAVQNDDPRIINGKVYLGEIEISVKAPPGVAGVAFPLTSPGSKYKEIFNLDDHHAWIKNAEMVREGWQCKVYFFEHHVIKVLNSYEDTWKIVARTGSGATSQAVKAVRDSVLPSMALLAEQKLPARMTAYFETLNDEVYIQRRGVRIADVVERYAKQADFTEIRALIKRIPEFVLELWRYGLSETSWKFENNFGISEDGELVLLDCLELTGDINVVREQLNKKTWRLRNKRFFNSMPSLLGEQFSEILANYLTAEKLQTVWASKREKASSSTGKMLGMATLNVWKKFDKRQLFRFFVDGRHHKKYQGWRGYEKSEAGSTAGMLRGYCLMLDNFDLSQGLTLDYIKSIHQACLSGVKVNVRTIEPGEFRYLVTGFVFRHGKVTSAGIEDTFRQRRGDGTPLFRNEAYVKTADEFTPAEVLAALKKEKQLRYRPWYPKLSTEQETILKKRSPVEEFARLKASIQEQIRQRGQTIVDHFNKAISHASSEEGKLLAIARLIRDLELLHPFPDGNCRTLATVLMNHLLMYFDLAPAILYDPNLDAQYSVEEYVEEIRRGMECTKRLLADPEAEEYAYRISEASVEDVSEFLAMASELIQKIDNF